MASNGLLLLIREGYLRVWTPFEQVKTLAIEWWNLIVEESILALNEVGKTSFVHQIAQLWCPSIS